MVEAGDIGGVRVLDHIVVGEAPAFVSLKHGASGEDPSHLAHVPYIDI